MKIQPRNVTNFENLCNVLNRIKIHINTKFNHSKIDTEGRWAVTYDMYFSEYHPSIEISLEDLNKYAFITKKYCLRDFRKLTHKQIFEEFFPNENTTK